MAHGQEDFNASLHDVEPNYGTSTLLNFLGRDWNAEQMFTLVKEFLWHAHCVKKLYLGSNSLDLRACKALSQASMVGCRGGNRNAGRAQRGAFRMLGGPLGTIR